MSDPTFIGLFLRHRGKSSPSNSKATFWFLWIFHEIRAVNAPRPCTMKWKLFSVKRNGEHPTIRWKMGLCCEQTTIHDRTKINLCFLNHIPTSIFSELKWPNRMRRIHCATSCSQSRLGYRDCSEKNDERNWIRIQFRHSKATYLIKCPNELSSRFVTVPRHSPSLVQRMPERLALRTSPAARSHGIRPFVFRTFCFDIKQ